MGEKNPNLQPEGFDPDTGEPEFGDNFNVADLWEQQHGGDTTAPAPSTQPEEQ